MTLPTISFVIPHRGREALLRRTLEGIRQQRGDRPREIILVTQNAALEPATRVLVDAVSAKVLFADPTLTISALRNLGVAASQGDFLAFLDADIALSEDWTENLLALLQETADTVIVSAMQACGDAPSPLERIRTALSNATVDDEVAFLPGRNLLLRRATFDAVGGFPEHLVTCEDYFFTGRVGALGRLLCSSRATYIHLGEDRRLGEMFRKEIWRGQSNLGSLRGRRVRLEELPSFIIPSVITLAVLVGLALLLLDRPGAAALAGLVGLLPFAAYVTRLYFLADRRIALRHVVAFYSYYFPARAWGTLIGVFRTVGRDLHNR